MSESLELAISGATQSALEMTAFFFADPGAPDDSAGEARPEPFTATVTFDGAHRGALSIEFPARLLPALAANVLGEEEVTDEATQRDALGELANIVCGNVLPAIDVHGKYSLGSPAVAAGTLPPADPDAVRVARADLQIEGERVRTALWLHAPGTPARAA